MVRGEECEIWIKKNKIFFGSPKRKSKFGNIWNSTGQKRLSFVRFRGFSVIQARKISR
jgi:hypothetical protein